VRVSNWPDIPGTKRLRMNKRRQGGSIFTEMCLDTHHTSLFSVLSLEAEHSFLPCEVLSFSV
jgi:hypothetical protein